MAAARDEERKRALRRAVWRGSLALGALAAAVLVLALLPSGTAEYYGIWGHAQEGCTCHAQDPSPDVTALLDGVPVTYTPGETYTLSINESGGPAAAPGLAQGGFGLKVSAGTLAAPDARERVGGLEATHSLEGNRARGWTVLWTAPDATAGRVTFWLSTNSVNGDNTTKGDEWNQLVTFSDPPGVEPPVNHPPVISGFDGPTDAQVGYPAVYAANATDPDGDGMRFSWSFGDGSAPSIGLRVTHVFLAAGDFQAVLTATDLRGANASFNFTVHVTVPAEPLPPTSLVFSNSLVDGEVVVGTPVEVKCSVRNTGDVPVTNIIMHLHYADGDDAARTHPIVPILLPNQTKVVQMTWTPKKTGDYELVVLGRGTEALGTPSEEVTLQVVPSPESPIDTTVGFLVFPAVAAFAVVALRRYNP